MILLYKVGGGLQNYGQVNLEALHWNHPILA